MIAKNDKPFFFSNVAQVRHRGFVRWRILNLRSFNAQLAKLRHNLK